MFVHNMCVCVTVHTEDTHTSHTRYTHTTVHSEDWFELFSEMPELTLETMGEYGESDGFRV